MAEEATVDSCLRRNDMQVESGGRVLPPAATPPLTH